MSFCTFWDYTILHRMRDYDDPREKNSNIFEYITSSNNRDGLAVKAAGMDLLKRQEDRKLLILLSDGKPYDVLVNRPNARNPKPYRDDYALHDTATEVRRILTAVVSIFPLSAMIFHLLRFRDLVAAFAAAAARSLLCFASSMASPYSFAKRAIGYFLSSR